MTHEYLNVVTSREVEKNRAFMGAVGSYRPTVSLGNLLRHDGDVVGPSEHRAPRDGRAAARSHRRWTEDGDYKLAVFLNPIDLRTTLSDESRPSALVRNPKTTQA